MTNIRTLTLALSIFFSINLWAQKNEKTAATIPKVMVDAGGPDEVYSGSLDWTAVRRVIRHALPKIKACYEKELSANANLAGKIVVRFVIGNQGKAREVSTKSTNMHNSEGVEKCVLARIREQKFPVPAPDTEAEIEYPFTFASKKEEKSGLFNTFGNRGVEADDGTTVSAGGPDEGYEGSIDREAVRRVIRSILEPIKGCYSRRLQASPKIAGKVVIRFVIEEQGKVRQASTKSTSLNDVTVETCVAARIREQRFPEPPPGTIAEVDYPFVFSMKK